MTSIGLFIRWWQVLVLVLVIACGKPPRTTSPDPESPAMLQVDNQGFSDMVIYASSGAQRVRLGLATGNSSKTFTIPAYLLRGASSLRFIADPIGGNRAPVSDEMTVHAGDVVTLTIPP